MQFLQTFLPSLSLLTQTHASNNYGNFGTTSLIPFNPTNSTIPFTDYQLIDFHFSPNASSKKYTPFIDTGSTGIVISAIDIPEYNASTASEFPPGWEYLSSSRRLYNGFWIPRSIYFNLDPDPDSNFNSAGDEGKKVKVVEARVPVLHVTSVTICNGTTKYNSTLNKNSCPTDPDGYLPPITQYPTGIRIMGVGFARQSDGMPQGTPDKNPFLNIVSINGEDVSSSSFRTGYIITAKGIEIGLTEKNMNGMKFLELDKISENKYDWGAIPACISINSQSCVNGTALLDTGLENSYITVPSNTSYTTIENATSLVHGSSVKIDFGNGDVAVDEFVVGPDVEEGTTPTKVSMTRSDTRVPFVNTGRHVYRAWDVAFDAVAGRVGFRPVDS